MNLSGEQKLISPAAQGGAPVLIQFPALGELCSGGPVLELNSYGQSMLGGMLPATGGLGSTAGLVEGSGK